MKSILQGSQNFYIRLLLITAVALCIRIYTAGWGGLSCDEVFCVNIVSAPSWAEMFHYLKLDGNPPLLYVLLRLWGLVFGFTDFSFRCFAVLIASAAAPVSYLIFRRNLGEKMALQIAILFAFCPPMIEFGCLVRGYGLLPLLSLLLTQQLINLLNNPARRGEQIKYGLLLAAIVYLHHWGEVVAIGHGILLVYGLLRRWWQADQLKAWAAAVAGAVLLYAPWALVLIEQLHSGVSPWIAAPQWEEVLFYAPAEAVAGYHYRPLWLLYVSTLYADLLMWGTLFAPFLVARRDDLDKNMDLRYWQIPALAGLSAAALISLIRPIWRDRYLTAFAPLILVNYVIVCDRLLRRAPGWLAATLPIALWFVTWLSQLWYFHIYPESSAWILAEQIGRQTNPKKDLVVISFETIAPMINRYLPEDVPSVSFPDLERVNVYRWAGADNRIRDAKRLDEFLARIKHVLDSGGGIWLVESVHVYLPISLDYPLDQLRFSNIEAVRMCQIRYWLLENAIMDKDDLWAPGREFPVMASHFRPRPAQSR